MPYTKAHYFLISLLIITFLAFWDSYFGVLKEASVAHHLHGISSTFWILLMALQSWLIHSKNLTLHRKLGKLLFILIPIMIGAFALVTLAGAHKSIAQHPFYILFGQALLSADLWLLLTMTLQIYLALRFRFKVRIHSALMLGTLIGLLAPILSRLFSKIIPPLEITGADTLYRFGYSIHITMFISLTIALFLFAKYKKEGWPWLLAASIVLVGWSLYGTLGQTVLWQNFVVVLATFNAYLVFLFGFIMGLLACLLGWKHGKKIQ